MPAIFEKMSWNKSAKPTLSQQAVANLTQQEKFTYPVAKLEDRPNIKTENKEIFKNEGQKMVTSTIVETNSSSSAAILAANEMVREEHELKYIAIKDASKKVEPVNSASKRRGRDFSSGMDLLEMDFLLSVVENTAGENEFDIKMRQMCFKELLRRESRHDIGSAAMKVYATTGQTYGKDIQCEAMLELMLRTTQNSK